MTDLKLDFLTSTNKIQGFTHNFYRYPARFSPEFAREIIQKFTHQNDVVLDIYMGGGTTIIEAIAAGRKAIGVDINSLSYFVSLVKTTPLSRRDKEAILEWVQNFQNDQSPIPVSYTESNLTNLPEDVRNFITAGTIKSNLLMFPRQQRFIKCALLKVGQWSVDFREPPSPTELKSRLANEVVHMFEGLDSLVEAARMSGLFKNQITQDRILINHSINSQSTLKRIASVESKPDIILTSPPYPGVHVLYHRWQIRGRKETPAPYWVTGLRDGNTEPYYTMGGRSNRGINVYFETLADAYFGLRGFLKPTTTIIQLVGFSDKATQLPRYLDAMKLAQYEEIFPSGFMDERLTRNVPNRKWYTSGSTSHDSGQEILLFHRPIF